MFNWSSFVGYLFNPYLLGGAGITIVLTVVSILGGLVLAAFLTLLRLSKWKWLSLPAKFYVWVFRGTPLLVQFVVIYTGLPQIGIRFDVVQSVILGLVLNEAAYLSEILRSGIQAIPRGQTDAARALGLTYLQGMRLIVWPQAIRIVIPALGNSVNGVLKATSVASVISMEELLRRSQVLMQERFEVLELFAVAGIYYLAMTTTWDIIQGRIEKHYGKSDAKVADTDQR